MFVMKVDVKVNTKKLDQIINRVYRSTDSIVKVGFFSEDSYEDGTPVAYVAMLNDQGVESPFQYIPARPFMSRDLLAVMKSPPNLKIIADMWKLILMGRMTKKQALAKIGENMQEALRAIIVAFDYPPNAQKTIDLKGFNDPLIDTRKMLNSVKWKLGTKRSLRVKNSFGSKAKRRD